MVPWPGKGESVKVGILPLVWAVNFNKKKKNPHLTTLMISWAVCLQTLSIFSISDKQSHCPPFFLCDGVGGGSDITHMKTHRYHVYRDPYLQRAAAAASSCHR